MDTGAAPAPREYGDGLWRHYADEDIPAPLAAALSAFAEHGYHGTSVREIAARAGLSVPGLYHHYPSKQSLLQGLLELTMSDLLGRSRAALEQSGVEPVERFDAVVESLLRFHMYRRAQAFVGSTEIRSLEPVFRADYIALRDEQQRMVDALVRAGVESGDFGCPHPVDAGRAVTTMCVGVSTWYRPTGRLEPDELVSRYLLIARQMVGYRSGS